MPSSTKDDYCLLHYNLAEELGKASDPGERQEWPKEGAEPVGKKQAKEGESVTKSRKYVLASLMF